MFSVRYRVVDIKSNFKQGSNEQKCICGQNETMEHICMYEKVNCKYIQEDNYSQISIGNLTQHIRIFEKFKGKLEAYTMINSKSESKQPSDSCYCDPQS